MRLILSATGASAGGFCKRSTSMKSSLGCRAMGESNAVHTRRPAMRRATAAAAERIYRERFGAADGSVPATFEASTAIADCRVLGFFMLRSEVLNSEWPDLDVCLQKV